MTQPETPSQNDAPPTSPKNYTAKLVVVLVVVGINLLGLWFLSKR